MKFERIQFIPIAVVRFTEAEIDLLVRCSQSHGDLFYKGVGQPGGFLYGIRKAGAFFPNHLSHANLEALLGITTACKHLTEQKDEDLMGSIARNLRLILGNLDERADISIHPSVELQESDKGMVSRDCDR